MHRTRVAALTTAVAAAAATAVAGLGGPAAGAPRADAGTLTVVQSYSGDSLDPDYGYTTQAQEADQMVYLPLLTYAAKSGAAGTRLIPGLATALPKITNGGRTYTLTLRAGLTYSNGKAVHASDVRFAIERSLRLQWGGSVFFDHIRGASAYAQHHAKSISGITVANAARRITFHLVAPYGAFANVLAFEAAAPIPSGTPMHPLASRPPVGVGPYEFGTITPFSRYTLKRNPSFAGFHIPGVPLGSFATIDVSTNDNPDKALAQVTGNSADVLDADVRPSAAAQAKGRVAAAGRYAKVPLANTEYFFLNTRIAPFDHQAAREAVNLALDRTALAKLSSGLIRPDGYFLPRTVVGHPGAAYPYGNPGKAVPAARLARAKKLVAKAGLRGNKVTVWSQSAQPRRRYGAYLVSVLNKIGFRASLKVVSDFDYFQKIGRVANHAQAGYANWSEDFPAPSDFYVLLDKRSIQQTNNENFGLVDDGHIQRVLRSLDRVPSTRLGSVAGRWAGLDRYVAKKGYVAVIGHDQAWKVTSARIDFTHTVVSPVDYLIFSTVRPKS